MSTYMKLKICNILDVDFHRELELGANIERSQVAGHAQGLVARSRKRGAKRNSIY